MTDDILNKQRLEEDLIRAIVQFQRYAEMPPIERNNFVINTLLELTKEARKAQLQECDLLPPYCEHKWLTRDHGWLCENCAKWSPA